MTISLNWSSEICSRSTSRRFNTESKLTLGVLEIIVNQLLDCLRCFRAKGVVHRDLKTDNILYMVDENERLNRIKVIDFGVALSLGPNAVMTCSRAKWWGPSRTWLPSRQEARAFSV